jgi:F0F1-type ATP synthase membrane subunit b/b'
MLSSPANGLMFWQWINFGLLVGGLAYLVNRYGAPYLVKPSAEIRKRIDEAREFGIEAAARTQEVERRIAHLSTDLKALKESAARSGRPR